MDIATYRKTNSLTQADLAKLLSDAGYPATQGLISQWEQGEVTVSADRALQLERVTGLKCEGLRPDLVWIRDAAGQITGYHVPLSGAA